jgi:hypothetical protein
MSARPKETVPGAKATEDKLIELVAEYHAAAILAKTYEKRFWDWEKRKRWLWDQIQNELSGQ